MWGSKIMKLALRLALLVALVSGTGCGYNRIQGLDEDAQAAWSEVLNQYQRRSDLVPNLVATVKGLVVSIVYAAPGPYEFTGGSRFCHEFAWLR